MSKDDNLLSVLLSQLYLPTCMQDSAHHSVTLPYDDMIRSFHSVDMGWQILVHLSSTVTTDDGDFSRYPIGIDDYRQSHPVYSLTIQYSNKLSRLHSWPYFDPTTHQLEP
jgi:hypothetical protein